MPDRLRTGEAALPPTWNAVLRRGEGYGWLEGCGVTLTDNSTDIEIRVGAGRVLSAGEYFDISETTKTLGDGDGTYPRKDLVYVDYAGNVTVASGTPAQPDPADREGEFTKSPTPPSGATLDGTLLAEVWVPAGATDSGDLDSTDISDRRIAETNALGAVPVETQRPAEGDLTRTRLWYNSNQSQFEAYVESNDEIVAFSTSLVTSFSGDTTRDIELFEGNIGGNWRVDGTFSYNTPAFEGSASLDFSGSAVGRAYSTEGSGLPYYPSPGDTIAAAVQLTSANSIVHIGWGKESDTFDGDYRLRLRQDDQVLKLFRAGESGDYEQLDEVSVSVSQDTWYIIEADYDGGGTGVHPYRIWSTTTASDPGQRDTKLAESTSPPQDTTFRGRGVSIRFGNAGRMDYLHAITS